MSSMSYSYSYAPPGLYTLRMASPTTCVVGYYLTPLRGFLSAIEGPFTLLLFFLYTGFQLHAPHGGACN
jgi:hypothetical protein